MYIPVSNPMNHAARIIRADAPRARGIALAREASQSSGMAVFLGLAGYAGSMALGMVSLGVLLALMR